MKEINNPFCISEIFYLIFINYLTRKDLQCVYNWDNVDFSCTSSANIDIIYFICIYMFIFYMFTHTHTHTHMYFYISLLYDMLYVIFDICVHFKNLVTVLSRLWYWIYKVKEWISTIFGLVQEYLSVAVSSWWLWISFCTVTWLIISTPWYQVCFFFNFFTI